ncbi:dihydroneopterin 2',3'-cyclic phosphate phosphodiesterase, partial [Candidatus Bathyarchaeota archaeon]
MAGIGELMSYVEMIGDEGLREKVRAFLEEQRVLLTGQAFKLEESPGGRSHHHAYPGGLVQHTIATVRLALALCDVVEQVYGAEVDRDVVLAAAILHDVMKAPCYRELEDGSYRLSQLGERLDHVSLAVAELARRGFPLEVLHAVAAHHAEHGPISPKTLEALVVHLADLADSKLNGAVLRAARFLL